MSAFHSILTVLATLVFAGIVFWAYSGRSRKQFEQAAWSVLRDEHADNGEGVQR